jgi:hypothetical protein
MKCSTNKLYNINKLISKQQNCGKKYKCLEKMFLNRNHIIKKMMKNCRDEKCANRVVKSKKYFNALADGGAGELMKCYKQNCNEEYTALSNAVSQESKNMKFIKSLVNKVKSKKITENDAIQQIKNKKLTKKNAKQFLKTCKEKFLKEEKLFKKNFL